MTAANAAPERFTDEQHEHAITSDHYEQTLLAAAAVFLLISLTICWSSDVLLRRHLARQGHRRTPLRLTWYCGGVVPVCGLM